MIRRNTWIVLILLAALVGFAYYWTNHKAQLAASATPTAEPGGASASARLFGEAEGSPTDINLQDTTGRSVEVARNASGSWVLKAPTEAPADQASAEAAATQVASLRVLSTVQLGFDVVGLDKPAYTARLTFSGGKSHTLTIGAETPIQDGYYASLDGGGTQVVDKAGIDALLKMLQEPPYLATATPAETATQPAPAVTPTLPGTSEATATAPSATQPAASPTP